MDKVCGIGEARGDLNFNPINLEGGLKSVFLKGEVVGNKLYL